MTSLDDSADTAARPFQVDLRGVVDLLSRHIYSGPRVYLRELLQNGRDAIAARGEVAGAMDSWGIRVTPATAQTPFRFVDEGVGLSLDEVGELLATVGRSSKRDIFDLPRSDYLGQFGIGLLSCFMVADQIAIRSRSAKGGAPVEWIGSADGTFTVRPLNEFDARGLAIGTEVTLHPRADVADLVRHPSVKALAIEYAEFLPVPIQIENLDGTFDTINRQPVFAKTGDARDDAHEQLVELGRELIGVEPLDIIELSVPGTDTRGTAYVLPYSPPPGSRQASRVYLGGMLLNARVDDLLPDHAFFVRCIVDTTLLRPTASREQFVEDEALEFTREQLGQALRAWVMRMATSNQARLAEFVSIHHLALRALIIHDDELASFITKWLTVETSNGILTIDQLVRRHPHVRFADTVDEFRQIAGIVSRDAPVVNGGYIYDADILRRLPHLFEGVTVERVTVTGELDNLDAPPLEEQAQAVDLERRAGAVLAESECDVVTRKFSPVDLPSLYLADADVLRSIERSTARGISSALWDGVLGRVDEHLSAARTERELGQPRARLCLNWASPLVRTLSATDDQTVFSRSVQLLYVQALLAGHRPLNAHDRGLLTTAMSDLIQLSISTD